MKGGVFGVVLAAPLAFYDSLLLLVFCLHVQGASAALYPIAALCVAVSSNGP